jgi:hypothetical protein
MTVGWTDNKTCTFVVEDDITGDEIYLKDFKEDIEAAATETMYLNTEENSGTGKRDATMVFENDLSSGEKTAVETAIGNYVYVAPDGCKTETVTVFEAPDLQLPLTSDWAVNQHAGGAPDSNNSGLRVLLLDNGDAFGFEKCIPAKMTKMHVKCWSRAETAPGAARTVGLGIYSRRIAADNVAVESWSSIYTMDDADIPANENWQCYSDTFTLAAASAAAEEFTQFEIKRQSPTGGTDLTGKWVLLRLEVGFS